MLTKDELKGHQIIGELRQALFSVDRLFIDWKVTRSLVSYDIDLFRGFKLLLWLKGHQIIGELRPIGRHHNILVFNWKVTRSLVSYDQSTLTKNPTLWLKGHQIIGELRPPFSSESIWARNWKVTRSLVSYDEQGVSYLEHPYIERSPDHWWVTTPTNARDDSSIALKGHQIIGELRQTTNVVFFTKTNWKVTRSLVSYDFNSFRKSKHNTLKGHQIIGELRLYWCCLVLSWPDIERSPDHWWVTTASSFLLSAPISLKGHQIIGELRHNVIKTLWYRQTLKGHQIIGELRLTKRSMSFALHIERSPDHWWVTTGTTPPNTFINRLKGHQIIGELRQFHRLL